MAKMTELDRLKAIEDAAKNLIKVKGRYHTELAYKRLAELLATTHASTQSAPRGVTP